jgi:molecular chaperone DnaK
VTPQTLGIGTAGGFMDPLVERNTPIPTMASKVFHTASANQTEVRIRVYQGDQREAMKNYLLGEFILDGLPPAERGEVRIRITFGIDADGIINVKALDSKTGRTKGLRVEASSSLSEAQVEELRFEEDDGLALAAPEAGSSGRDLFAELDAEDLELDPPTEELNLDEDAQ